MFPAIKTRKFYATAGGTFGAPVGSESAQIVFAPPRLLNNGAVDNVSPAVLFSKAGGTAYGNQFFPYDDGLPWNDGFSWLNTEYGQPELINVDGVGIKFRCVGAGLRVKYTGNMVNASGIYAAVEHADHQTLSGLTLEQISQLDSYFSVSVVSAMENKNDPWVYLTYTPVAMDDFDFMSDPIANNTWSTQGNRNHFMGFLLSGIPVGTDSFSWEAIVHYEAIGQFVRGKTDTPADPLGTATVLNTVKPETQKQNNTAQPIKAAVAAGTQDMSLPSLKDIGEITKEMVALL